MILKYRYIQLQLEVLVQARWRTALMKRTGGSGGTGVGRFPLRVWLGLSRSRSRFMAARAATSISLPRGHIYRRICPTEVFRYGDLARNLMQMMMPSNLQGFVLHPLEEKIIKYNYFKENKCILTIILMKNEGNPISLQERACKETTHP